MALTPEKELLEQIAAFLDADGSPSDSSVVQRAAELYNLATGNSDSCKSCNFYTYYNYFKALFTVPYYIKMNTPHLTKYKINPIHADTGCFVLDGDKIPITQMNNGIAELSLRRGCNWVIPMSEAEIAEMEAQKSEDAINFEKVEVEDVAGAIIISEPDKVIIKKSKSKI